MTPLRSDTTLASKLRGSPHVANGSWNGTTEFGESVVKLASSTSGLSPADYYTPNDYAELNIDTSNCPVCSEYNSTACLPANVLNLVAPGDYDLGSGGVTLIKPWATSPTCGTNAELVAGGKEGVLYGICYNTQATTQTMGGLDGCGYGCSSTTSTPSVTACTQSGAGSIAQCLQGVNAGENANGTGTILNSPGIRGTEAFWAGLSASQNYLYVGGSAAAMVAFQASGSTGQFAIAGDPEQSPHVFPYPGTVPSVSWNSSSATTGLLWALDMAGYGLWNTSLQTAQAAKPAILYVYNATPTLVNNRLILAKLWESDIAGTNGSNSGPGSVKFTVPTVAGGLVFVPGGTPGYAPGPPNIANSNVNCTASYLVTSSTLACGGMLSVYGKLTSGN